MNVSFLIPVYNGAGTIAELIERVTAPPFEKELIVIDDGSTDGSAAILNRVVQSAPTDLKTSLNDALREHGIGTG